MPSRLFGPRTRPESGSSASRELLDFRSRCERYDRRLEEFAGSEAGIMVFLVINPRSEVIRTFTTIEEARAFIAQYTERWIIVDEQGRTVE